MESVRSRIVRDYGRLDKTAFARNRLAGLRALVVGAGALGNEVIKNLALVGIGRLDILDRDRVEASNLTRSVLFCTRDIADHIAAGTPKAQFAARRVQEINPDVIVDSYVGEVGDLGAGIIRRADVVFSCVDNEMARLELGWVCSRLGKLLVDAGLGLVNPSSGMVSVFRSADGPCYACRKGGARRRMLLQELHGREDSCIVKERLQREAAAIPTTPTMASIVGAMQVEIGVREAVETAAAGSPTTGTSHRVILHPDVRLDTSRFERSPNCPLHDPESVFRTIDERPDRVSEQWTPAQMLQETGSDATFLIFDWPITARASCRGCKHEWEPLMRRARFRRERCPRCHGDDLVEIEVLTGVAADGPWSQRSLAALGLPRGHIHEVVVGLERRHIEVTGDLRATVSASC